MAPQRDTPIPGENGSIKLPRLSWQWLWAALLVGGGIATKYVYVTKEELHVTKEAQAKVASDLVLQTALNQQAVNHTMEGQKDIKADVASLVDAVQVLDTNVRTLMIEIEVPKEKIAKPPKKVR